MVTDIIGWIGAGLVVAAYFLVSAKKLPPQSRIYQSMNLLGAFGVGVNVLVQGAYPAFAIQIAWASVAIYGLYKAFKK